MYYFYYFIRIFREIFGRRALKKILVIAIIGIALFFLLRVNGYCTTDVIDINQSIYSRYESVSSDFLNRINFYQSSSSIGVDTKTQILDKLKNGNYNYYIYYDNLDGSSMLNGTTFNSYSLNIAFFDTQNTSTSLSTYEKYYNYTTSIVRTNNIDVIYTLSNGNITVTNYTNYIHFPTLLYTYKPQVITNFLNTNDTDRIVGAIEEGNAINQATQDFVTDDSLDTQEMSVDTSQAQINDTSGINDFYSTFLTSIQNRLTNYNENDVTTITIPLPNNVPDLVLRSDILSRYIGNTPIGSLIQVFWTFLFGGYIISFIMRMIKWLTTGRVFNEGGVSDFIWYLDTNNEIIKGYMM